ncbi:MAG: SPFH domain-containing protein [Desulfobacteraceae bacterium]|jgi:membrane protease subunit (stomatin/prohibitin family)
MALWEKAKAEFVDIIEWTDDSRDTMVWRFPRFQNEIKYGAKLTVRESQVAVFVSQGTIADVFKPGMVSLTTKNLPVLTTLKSWAYGFDSPFKAEVYFINTKNFTDLKWGTKNPVMLRDPEFGPVRMRAFGTYVMKVKDPATFIREIVGTDAHFTVDEISDQLRSMISGRFADILAESRIPVLDLASNYKDLSTFITQRLASEFMAYGLELTLLVIENISLPPEVEEALDKRTSMGIIGDLNKYTQFQAANAMEKAAANPGGDASAGIGMGMGFAMANQMGKVLQPEAQQKPLAGDAPPPIPGEASVVYFVALGGEQKGPFAAKIIREMIKDKALRPGTLMWKKGLGSWVKASEIPELKEAFDAVPPPIPS